MDGTPWHNQRGMSFVTVLLALLIALAAYFGYFTARDTAGSRPGSLAALDGSRAAACRANRQMIERDLVAWAQMHDGETPTLDALAAGGVHVPSCPDAGSYRMAGGSVRCSKHP
jgi:hypothetical protein